MTNQAAQTMPLPEPEVHDAAGFRRAYTAAQMHQYARDYAAALSQTAGVPEPLPMDTAPRDGTMVRLLVNFTDHATEDTAGPAWTIGAYPSDDESGGWQFAGWCWTHDHFTEGEGTPIGWLPMLAAAPAASGGEPHPDALPDGTLSKSTAKRVEALAAASASERARDDEFSLSADDLATWLDRKYARHGEDEDRQAAAMIRKLQALTQQRGEQEPIAWFSVSGYGGSLFVSEHKESVERWITEQNKDQDRRRVSPGYRHTGPFPLIDGRATPQPSADAVRELVKRMRKRADELEEDSLEADSIGHATMAAVLEGKSKVLREVADELETLLSGGSHA